jgi:hypothetical protein
MRLSYTGLQAEGEALRPVYEAEGKALRPVYEA